MVVYTPAFRNELLAALPPDELDRLRPNLHPVTFVLRQVLHEVGSPMDVNQRWVSALISAIRF